MYPMTLLSFFLALSLLTASLPITTTIKLNARAASASVCASLDTAIQDIGSAVGILSTIVSSGNAEAAPLLTQLQSAESQLVTAGTEALCAITKRDMIAAEPAVVEERDGQTPNESLVKRNLIDVTQMIIQIVRIVGDDLTTTVEAGEALTEMEEELNEAMSVLNGLE